MSLPAHTLPRTLLLAGAPALGLSFPLAAQTAPDSATSQVAPATGGPAPAAETSGWSDIGIWGVLGLVILLAVVIVFIRGRKGRGR